MHARFDNYVYTLQWVNMPQNSFYILYMSKDSYLHDMPKIPTINLLQSHYEYHLITKP